MIPFLNAVLLCIAFFAFCCGMAPKSTSIPERERRDLRFLVATVLLFFGLVVKL